MMALKLEGNIFDFIKLLPMRSVRPLHIIQELGRSIAGGPPEGSRYRWERQVSELERQGTDARSRLQVHLPQQGLKNRVRTNTIVGLRSLE
jgi:hypothetical protein